MRVNKKDIEEFRMWRKSFLTGTDKEIIKKWFNNYETKIKQLEKIGGEYEEEKIILALCYIDGLSRFKNGLTSKRLFINFLSSYSSINIDLANKIYQWHRCFGVHHGKILGISKIGKLDFKLNPPQISSNFILEKLKICFNKLKKEMV